ncbi:MAG: protease modulator HflC [Victivallaceae bacterium]|nr:protease modulator HflC [Victivallaceae bacterium]
MKRFLLIALGFGLLAIFAFYLLTFQVEFDKSVLLSTFGKVTPENVINADGTQAGLHFKWPYPIQKAIPLERRTMVFNDRLEQQETLDKQVVILKTYLAWRIVDPLNFYRSFKTKEYCERFLAERLRSARSEIGSFTFDDLTNINPKKLKIAEAEEAILMRMRRELSGQDCGIEIQTVGISRIELPEQITSSVFARMTQTRQRLAQQARSEGDAIAQGIRAKTDSELKRIMAYANREAQTIRAEGDAEAAEQYKVFAKDEKLAIFLRNLEALKTTLANNSTFLLDTKIVPFDLLKELQGKGAPDEQK